MASRPKKRSQRATSTPNPAPGRALPLVPLAVIAMAVLALVGAVVMILRPGPQASAKAAPGSGQSYGTPTTAARSPAGSSRSPQKTAVTAQDGAVSLALADYSDGTARFYTYKGANKTITFFVLKGSDGNMRAAFDACDVCYAAKKGYRQEGDVMVCNNCGNRFPSIKINVETGGCNPGPLKMQVQGDKLVIQASDIEAGARYF